MQLTQCRFLCYDGTGNLEERTARMAAYIYILECQDGSLYTGITTDPVKRMRQHCGALAAAPSTREAIRHGSSVPCGKPAAIGMQHGLRRAANGSPARRSSGCWNRRHAGRSFCRHSPNWNLHQFPHFRWNCAPIPPESLFFCRQIQKKAAASPCSRLFLFAKIISIRGMRSICCVYRSSRHSAYFTVI